MNKMKVFVVDDNRLFRVTLSDELRDAGYDVYEFTNGQAVLAQIRDNTPDVIISDIKMPHMSGLELLAVIKRDYKDISFILMTAYASIDSAVKAMKEGAYDYLVKPFESEKLMIILHRLNEFNRLKEENIAFKKSFYGKFNFSSFIGQSRAIKKVFGLVEKVINSDTTILITGETGTGKELLTNIIHYNSTRKNNPFVKVSCAILAKEIFESELFGHVKGAFTGAEQAKKGRFEMAHGGTLYLDDIDDMPYDLQVKLLRVLEEGEVEPLGSSETLKVDVRIIASTKKDLGRMVKEGSFRQDLFYRLNVFPVHLPPLRERIGDIRILMDFFAEKYGQGKKIILEEEVYRTLSNYRFPGNVRELKNLMERLVLISDNNRIQLKNIPFEIRNPDSPEAFIPNEGKTLNEQLIAFEKNAIKKALEKYEGNKSKAADYLGLPVSTLRSKMEKYNLVL